MTSKDEINAETAPLMVKSAEHTRMDELSGKPSRPHQAADYVEANAEQGNPQSVLDCIDTFASNERWMMNMGPEKGPILGEVFSRLNKRPRILELGAYGGYSAILMASLSGGSITSVELEQDYVAAARRNVAVAALSDRIEFICGKSSEVIERFNEPFDLVLLDHWKKFYESDLKLIESRELLRAGSIVVADNVGEIFEQEKYLEYVRTCGHYQSEHHIATIEYTSVPDGVEISVFTPHDA